MTAGEGAMSAAPWGGLTIVQAGDSIACSFAAKLLVELGATCVALNLPNAAGPSAEGIERTILDWGKRRVALDDAAPLEQLAGMAERADILVRSRLPEPLETAWRGRVNGAPSRLIELVITPFGESGPYRDLRADSGALQALSGLAYTSGAPDREPLSTQPEVVEYFAGAHGLLALLAALHWRGRTGEGSRIELSGHDVAVAFDEYNLLVAGAMGVVRKRFYSHVIFGYPSDIFECRDGYVSFMGVGRYIEHLPLLLERPELLGTPMYDDPAYRANHWRELDDELVPWFRAQERDDIVRRMQELRMPVAPVLGVPELMEHPHIQHRKSIRRVRDGEGELALVAPPFRLESYVPPEERRALPGVDALAPTPSPRRRYDTPTLPFEGVRVADFSRVWAGPACTRMLAQLGADVVKIEGPANIDNVRGLFLVDNDAREDYWNHSAYFHNRNQNKRGIAIDLSEDAGRDAIRRLLTSCDVIVENFTPRVMHNLGLDYEAVSAINPRLVMVSMGGYGSSGPFANHAALGMALDGSSGLASGNGYPGGPPEKSGTAILDPFAGVCAASAVAAALLEREHTGRGQHVDLSQHEAALSLVGGWIAEYARTGAVPERRGNRSGRHAPQGMYPCAGGDEWIYLSVRDEPAWAALCEVLDSDLAEEPRFASLAGRLEEHDALDKRLAARTRQWDKHALMRALQDRGVIAAAVLDGEEVLADPHLRARGTFEAIALGDVPEGMSTELLSQRYVPARFDRFEIAAARPAPRLGEHNREVLQGLAAFSDEEYGALERSGVVASEPVLALPLEEMQAAVRFPVEQWVERGLARPVRGPIPAADGER